MPGLFDDLIQEARKGRQPERRTGLFDDLIQQRQQKELTPEEAIRLHDEATGTLEQAKHDVKRSGLNFLQAITASLLSSEDPIADLEASVMATRFGGAAPRPFVRRSTPEEIAAVKRSLADELVKRGQEIRSIPRRPVMEQLGEAESFGETVEAVSRDPLGAVAGISLESSAQMVPTILAGILNPVAGAITAGVTSGLSEQNMAVLEFLANKGMDFSDPDAVVAAFSDPELMQEAEARGLTRGAIIGTLAMLSAGLASKTLVPLRNAVAREAVNIPAQMAVQAAAGGGGEALAQLATEGEITAPGDIVAEIIGETSTAPLDVASFSTGRVREAIERRRDERLIDAIRKEFARMQQEPASSDQQVPSAAAATAPVGSPAQEVVPEVVKPAAAARAAPAVQEAAQQRGQQAAQVIPPETAPSTEVPSALKEVRETLGAPPATPLATSPATPPATPPATSKSMQFKPGPNSTRYRVGSVAATGGVMFERDHAGGTRGSYYVNVDGRIEETNRFRLNRPEDRKRIWQPPDERTRQAAEAALDELGQAPVGSPEAAAAREKLRRIVKGENSDAGAESSARKEPTPAPPPAQTPAGIAPTLNTQAQPAAEAAPSDSSPVAAEGTVSGVVNPTAPAQAASASPPAQTPMGVAPTLRERAQKALRDITELARRKKEWVFDLELRSGDEDRWLARYATKYMDELPEDTQQFLFGRPAFDQETGATHRIGIVDENDDMGSDGEVHGAHIFNLRMLAEDDTENSNTPSALEEVRELVTPATVEQPNAGQQPLSGPEVEAIPGRIEASSALGETGAQLEGIAGITPEAATEARRGRRRKGPLDAYADRPVGRSFYTSVFEEAGLDPAQAELLPSDEQFNIVTQQLREKYGFRSIKKEQGHNWREAVDAALDAHQNLQSMAAALGLPIKAMSLNGKIDLQLTKGGDGALAWHMGIPGKGSVVGVSRRNAAFGHEWMHALDHELLERTGARNADLISGRLLTGKLRRGLDLSRAEPNLVEAVSDVLHALYRDDAAKAALVRTLELQLEKATDKQEQDRIRKQLARVRRNQPPESSYYQGAVALDRGKFQTPEAGSDKGYWQRPTEMWARAGEAYIARNIERMGGGTEFVSLRNDQYMQESVEFFEKAYPQKADRERIFAAFDQLFAVIQNLQIFGTEKPPAAARDNAYFNQMDPRLWAASAIPDKWAGLPAYRRLIGRLSDAIKEEAEATRRDAEEVRARLSNSKTELDQPMLQYIKRLLASSVYSMRGTIMFLKEVYPRSHAIDEIFRKLITRPGTGSFTGRTYEEAVIQYVNTKSAVLARLVRKHELHKLLPDELRALRDMLTGVRTSGPAYLQLAARDLRFFLDQIWYDVQQAGIDIGYTRNGYLPRIFDHERIEREPHEFLKAATEVYYLMFEDIKDETAREAQARAAAEDWLFRIRTSGIDSFDRNGIASANFTKGRKLPPEADELLADFMILDPLELIQTYIMQVSRRIAWAERFGANDQGLKALIDQMAKEGMRSEDIKLAVAVIEAATGQRKSLLPRPVQAFLSWLHAIGTVTLLPRAVLNSIAEPATVGLRAGDVRDSFKAFAKTLSALVRTAEGQEMRELAEFLGIISDPLTDQLLANRFGGVFHDSKTATRMLGRFFYRNGLHALTSAQRAGAIPLADAYIRTWCRKLLEGKGGAAVPMLSELGINPSKSLEFAKWLLELGHRPTIEDLEAAPPLMKDLYQTAINRFIDEAIQNVKAVDRPLMTHNPVGRLIFGFTGFLWAFQRNVIMRTIHLFGAALKGKYGGYALSPQERMTAFSLGLIPPIITLLAIHITVSTIREMLFNPDRFEDLGDDFWDRALSGENLMLGLSRSGVAGAFDPLFNAYTGLRYQRDLANVMIGPIPGYVLQSSQEVMAGFQRNSPNTNTAEFNQIKGLYKLAAAPAVNTALTWLPGGPLRSAAYGGLMMALSSPQMATEAAELAVGPKGSETSEGGKRLSAQERREKRREEREKRRIERRRRRREEA